MALDVEPPAPPDLTNRGVPDVLDPQDVVDTLGDLRRAELEEVFHDGAWGEAFRDWAGYTDITDEEYDAITEHGLIDELDFFWDPTEERLRFELPPLPDALTRRTKLAAHIKVELSELGDTVVDVVQTAYLDWSSDEAIDSWSDELFEE